MTNRLIAQTETNSDAEGRTFGAEMFYDSTEDFFTARFHVRSHDGIRVASSWTTETIRLNATARGAAWREAEGHLADLRDLYARPVDA